MTQISSPVLLCDDYKGDTNNTIVPLPGHSAEYPAKTLLGAGECTEKVALFGHVACMLGI